MNTIIDYPNECISTKLINHLNFVQQRYQSKGGFKYLNKHYEFPVITHQETQLLINRLERITETNHNNFHVMYSDEPQQEFCGDWKRFLSTKPEISDTKKANSNKLKKQQVQLTLLD